MAIAIFCALECEARIFIETFKLKKTHQFASCKFFSNDNYIVVVTGIGKKFSYLAMGLFHATFTNFNGHLINFGCAGHKTEEIGSLFSINQVKNEHDQKIFLNPTTKTISVKILKTVNSPTSTYDEDYLVDMEGFYFLDAATTFYNIDNLHIYKFISDNQFKPFSEIKKPEILSMLQEKKSVLIDVLNRLPEIDHKNLDYFYDHAKSNWKISETEFHQLKRLIERSLALSISFSLDDFSSFEEFKKFINLQISNQFSA